MPFQMRFRMLSTLLLSLIVPAGSASADMRFNFENCYNKKGKYEEIIMSKFLKSLCKIAIPVTLQSMLQSSFSIVDQLLTRS